MTASSRWLDTPLATQHGLVTISGSFAPAGTGAVTSVKGGGFTVARTGVGEYTITLDKRYADLVTAEAQIQMASATDLLPQFGAYTAASRTIVLRAQAAATPTEIAANANNRVHFKLTMLNRGAVS